MKRILVVGDLIIDKYLYCSVNRLSPEAPLPIAKVEREEIKPGGAGNVLLNLLNLEQKVTFIGAINCYTFEGRTVYNQIEKVMDKGGMFIVDSQNNVIKTRVIGNNYHLMFRIDHEEEANCPSFISLFACPKYIKEADIIVIIDYNKGTMTKELIDYIFENKREETITIGNIKPEKVFCYKHINIFKPNEKDYIKFIQRPLSVGFCDNTIVNLGSCEVKIFDKDGNKKDCISITKPKFIVDTTASEDLFIATFTSAFSSGFSIKESCEVALYCTKWAIQQFGTSIIPKDYYVEVLHKITNKE
jgi:D-glycero-beta-D-manno-heptose-7-phosphate kinase